MNSTHPTQRVDLHWDAIDTVMLDMDGTLLDKYFDDYFWEKYVPKIYAQIHQLSSESAEKELLDKYRSVENTLQWTDLNYWSRQLDLDIPQLKHDISHLINVHDHVDSFLHHIKSLGKRLCLLTNAHSKTLEIKLEKTGIGRFFDTIICSEEVGEAKEQIDFWYKLEKMYEFDRDRSLFADDTEKVLHSADSYGIKYLVHVAKPSSRLPVKYSTKYPSIRDFSELIMN